jgi:signal transduction histidine kinase
MTDQSGAGQAIPAEQAAPAPAPVEVQDNPNQAQQRPAARKNSRLALKNWRVSWRLIALIAIPTVTAMYFGGVRIDDAMHNATTYQHIQQLSSLGRAVTQLSYAMEDERDQLVGYVAAGRPPRNGSSPAPAGAPSLASVENTQFGATNSAAARVTSLAAGVNSGYPIQIRNDLAAVIDRLNDLKQYRFAATTSKAPSLTINDDYSNAINDLFTLNDQIAQGSSDPTLNTSVRALGALARAEDQATQQRGILFGALLANGFEPNAAQSLSSAFAQQQAEQNEFTDDATLEETQLFQDKVAGQQVDDAQGMELQALNSTNNANGSLLVTKPQGFKDSTAAAWNTDMSQTVSRMRAIEDGLVTSIIGQAQRLHSSAANTAVQTGIVVLIVLIIVLMITIIVARSMVRPLRKLRTGALEVAGLKLPETVRRMSETDGEGVSLEVQPIDVDSSDEIGEVARAFDQVHREALRLAANEAALRGNVNAMFVNLSRRSQSLVERQIRLIDDLEQGEQDPERLSSLFQMDHLATRMRRNSENLLVLAGHDEARRWNQPVALVDVLRAALSEIEQYERVTLNVQPGITVRGQAVSDVVHLTAELVENATSFSAAETPVTIAGHLLSSGGVLLEITDQGVGMGAEEMAHANWRLDNPPVVDVAVSRRMGLFVVARLAARHGIRVRLRPAASGGLIALVWLPDEAIMHESPDGTPGLRRDSAPEPVPGPVGGDGAFAGGTNGGGLASGWGDLSHPGSTEQEVNAARAPRFASLRADAEESSLGPKRIPGAGPRPGGPGWGTTGPLPAFRTVPRPASDSGSDSVPAVTSPQPAVPASPAAGGNGDAPPGPEDNAPDAPATFDSFATGPQPAVGSGDAPMSTGPHPVLGAPATATWEAGLSRSGVVVPPADSIGGGEHRLPIFEAVESDWFRRGRQSVGRPSAQEEPAGNGWSSPADEGWRAAEVVHAPSSAGVTPAGLPKRVPQANLVPGAAGAAAAASPALAPGRSAAATRDRFASFQRGARQGRAASGGQAGSSDGEDESSE